MSARLIIIFFVFSIQLNAQTVDSVLRSIEYKELGISLKHNLDSLLKISSEINKNYIGFSNSKYNDKVIYDKKNKLFLFPSFYQDSFITSFNIYCENGIPLARWEFISITFNSHHLTYFNKYEQNSKNSFIIGCPNGQKCKFHKFDKQLFSGLTMNKTIEEFDETLIEIISRSR